MIFAERQVGKRRINTTIGGVTVQLDTKRVDSNLSEAQKLLNEQIVIDSEPHVPFAQGGLRGSVRFPGGVYGGEIEYDSPYAHYQYVGEIYGPNIPEMDENGNIIGYWSPPVKKNTGRFMEYHTPGTGSRWFETAKAEHKKEWIELVKHTAGKE